METLVENKERYTLTISIVTFNNRDKIEKALNSVIAAGALLDSYHIIVVDNGSSDSTPEFIATHFPQVTIIHSENVGYGAGHNKAMNEIKGLSQYHLVMNPDVYFPQEVFQQLIRFMDETPDAGLVMPKILYPDNSIQYLCKMLPTPFDLIGRRFLPGFLKPLFRNHSTRYEFRHKNYEEMMNVPHLSGCFMFLRSQVLETVGGFDPRFFMYLEDVDFSRRIHLLYRTLYYPFVSIYHHYNQGSYKKWRLLKYHVTSAVKYFNKWGWFFDKERRIINRSL